ncbi:Crp/Fnr family transcriptional regulator [Streptomyces coffeae]|uniref:Crp/Fnr family transcriptional regulator n=1 Tax=Streptomyces coffeae TaxID=621382 RepID=A0ABS1N8F8_9ACTN|nr:helix-turn-helix domain-containing protein [Streptomyces coffeae]MBL1096365.1 Crp/Fnr family transcriptional regulator [Streptomyces coffeae]
MRSPEMEMIRNYFDRYGLPKETMAALEDACRGRNYPRGGSFSNGGRYVRFVVQGCVSEHTPSGETRLWGRHAVIGDLYVGRRFVKSGRLRPPRGRGKFLSDAQAIVIGTGALHTMALHDPAVMRVINALNMERNAVMEEVYAANRRSPTARVATLLDYLLDDGGSSRFKLVRKTEHDGKVVVMGFDRSLAIEGPSQSQIAEALALGRATVEKVIASLRKDGVLATPSPGLRTNRYYEVKDRDRLKEIALGA